MQSQRSSIRLIVLLLILVLMAFPIIFGSNPSAPLCLAEAGAQNNPCLAQEATISAQQVQILELEATNRVQGEQIQDLQATVASRTAILTISTPIIIEIVITAIPSPEASQESNAEATDESTVATTLMLPPTAVNAQIEIVEVVNPGDVTAEGVVIRNTGSTIDITRWTLSDSQGNVFTFPEQLLFSNGRVTVFTRVGQNTPAALYWGRSEAVWGEQGDAAILADVEGETQSVFRLE